jgi:PAS domain S-box-containing protein
LFLKFYILDLKMGNGASTVNTVQVAAHIANHAHEQTSDHQRALAQQQQSSSQSQQQQPAHTGPVHTHQPTYAAWAPTSASASQKAIANVAAIRAKSRRDLNAAINKYYYGNEALLEEFMVEVYEHGNAFEAVKRILNDSNARNYFRKYLKSEFAAEGLLFYEEVELFRRASEGLSSSSSTKQQQQVLSFLKSIHANYLAPGSDNEVNISDHMKTHLVQQLKQMQSQGSDEQSQKLPNLFQTLDAAQREVTAILAMNGFPRYILSADFKLWRADENSAAKQMTLAQLELSQKEPRPSTLLLNALAHMEPPELQALFTSDKISGGMKWLRQFIAMAEVLPLSITIATSSQARRGFPIIYANPEFCTLTGYTKAEIIGRNVRDLVQKPQKTERESVQNVGIALSKYERISVDATNFTKDGHFYRILLTLHPFFVDSNDLDGQTAENKSNHGGNEEDNCTCLYYVGIQHDITGEGASSKILKFAESLMAKLPVMLQ